MLIRTKLFPSTISKAFSGASVANRTTRIRLQTHSLALTRATTAPFSTRSNGMRMLLETAETDYDLRSASTNAARIAFQASNPFNDRKAHNCMISFPREETIEVEGEVTDQTMLDKFMGNDLFDKSKRILRTELDKAVENAGHAVSCIFVAS